MFKHCNESERRIPFTHEIPVGLTIIVECFSMEIATKKVIVVVEFGKIDN